ncbi:MAG: DUF5060 domain-containing protein [Chloroflexota bacterium]|nr:DUF5060 domain-containing protein [Chloroflexota bacterium]
MSATERSQQVERWGLFELALPGPSQGNPFVEVELRTRFRHLHREVAVDGFYDGDGVYRVRFMPDVEGEWSYTTASNRSELDGQTGVFSCVAPAPDNHGHVQVHNTFHFSYADGTPYRPFGTTCYAWTHQPQAVQAQTLRTLSTSPFNKLRMCVFPKYYTFNTADPDLFPFERVGGGWDFARFNPEFFRRFEQRVGDLLDLGSEADVILFHPYDQWGFARMGAEADARYVRYVVSRLAAYRNVWWSLANEYDLMDKPVSAWDRLFQIVQEHDPIQHLRSIHNWQRLDTHACETFYDHGKPWVTHCSIQHGHPDLAPTWRAQYQKPVVLDEVCYEGDLPNGWGNVTGADLTHRFWQGIVGGGYVTHGETFLRPDDVIWWAKGGDLQGESPARIAFLRRILEDAPSEGLDVVGEVTNTHLPSTGQVGAFYLTYFGPRQPARVTLSLPEGQRYRADLIDTWEMGVTPLTDSAQHGSTIHLPGKPYLTLRLRRIASDPA